MRLHDFTGSGNGHKVRLLLSNLGQKYELVEHNILTGETHTPEFLTLNPGGKIPVLETDEGKYLPESNAILWFLAEGTEFMPKDAWSRAEALRWMFFEQYSHEPFIAVARFWLHYVEMTPDQQSQLAEKQTRGYQALDVMEQHLLKHDWFAGDAYSIADISLFGYTHVAHEGGFDLAKYPGIRAWLERVGAQAGHIIMEPH
ncbi:MAG: glutathione S-transferase family protein [Alphaproteobacteria bacterium]|jgi:glutathione S-transferase|nr:glutathione S-transferase family protein [Alphaproteobacteria bacterium]MBT4017460.1 glutathione S-transferase family protein [Alphaproteobacteria bacterium]MBT4966717.1 glutathione S-transferase family protein [Alphaproteobacteria bacterium]MBT5158327.1 glutathione S-transferase family protein [Alphaproteobacteria bacterium]MBT5918968.1 glutathione S-transferase family protein [Alphaproteobacteria bacterium]